MLDAEHDSHEGHVCNMHRVWVIAALVRGERPVGGSLCGEGCAGWSPMVERWMNWLVRL